MSASRQILATVLRVDAGAFDAAFTIRSGLGVTLALLIGFASGQPLFAVAAAMGAMSTGFASLQGVYRTRAYVMLSMSLAMGLSTIAGGIAARSVPLEILALALWGAIYGLISSLGPGASAVGLNATIALVIFSNFPLDAHDTLAAAGFMIFGGVLQTALLVATWPVVRYPQERHALAAAFRALGTYAAEMDCADPSVPPAAPLETVRATLEDPRPFGRRATMTAFQTLLDEATRIRATLGRIASTNCAAYLEHAQLVARTLAYVADGIDRGAIRDDAELVSAIEMPPSDPLVSALFGQLRAAVRSASIPLGGFAVRSPSLPHFERSDFEESLAILRSNLNLDATFGRHALRVGVTLAVAGVLAHVLPVARGYWMTLTASLVLRPDFTTTYVRGIARIAGTLLGVVVASAIVTLIPNAPHVALTLAILFAVSGYGVFQMNYGLYTVTLTAYVVFILSLTGLTERTAALDRAIATLAGGAIAMLSYAVWPTWEAPQTRARLRALLAADRAYLDAVLRGRPPSRERDDVWSARAAADASLERMLAEPPANDDVPRDDALGIMAASQRIGLANLTLSAIGATEPLEERTMEPFVAAIDAAFERIDRALAGNPLPLQPFALREAYATLHLNREVAATLDMLVDAVNTIAEIVQPARET